MAYRFYCVDNVNETRTLASGSGFLRRISINKKGNAGSIITIYDNTSGNGTLIAKIDPAIDINSCEYDLVFNNGLTYVTTGSPGNFTVVYD